ncbi:MAG: hypothetical protein GX660_16740 [Clostridiaceae bacterium]|nr:hypothetical protein [Clostridiaceae bacterium]
MKRGFLFSGWFIKITVFSVIVPFLFYFTVTSYSQQGLEVPEKTYAGIDNAEVILKNIDFQDV